MSEPWDLASLRAATLEWLRSNQWLGGKCNAAQVDKWRFCEFAMLWFPLGSREDVLLASIWSHLIAVLDDVCEDDRRAIARLRGGAQQDPALEVLAAAWSNLEASIAVNDRAAEAYLTEAFADLLTAYEWEHDWREARQFPPFDEYDAWRWRSGGLKIYGAVLARHSDVPISRFAEPRFQEALQAAGTLACMANDAASIDWDAAQGNPINAGCISKAHGGRTLEQWTASWQTRLSNLLGNETFADAPRFATSLATIVQGTEEWMRRTGRYAGGSGS